MIDRPLNRLTCCTIVRLSPYPSLLVQQVPYSRYFSGGKILVSSEYLASSWKNFHGRGILKHTLILCGTVSWVKILCFASQPRKPQKFYPLKNTRYTVLSIFSTEYTNSSVVIRVHKFICNSLHLLKARCQELQMNLHVLCSSTV